MFRLLLLLATISFSLSICAESIDDIEQPDADTETPPECLTDDDCGRFMKCIAETCSLSRNLCPYKTQVAPVPISAPPSGNIAVISPTEQTVLASFTILPTENYCSERVFKLDTVSVSFEKTKSHIDLENVQLIYDVDKDGKISEEDEILTEPVTVDRSSNTFTINKDQHYFSADISNNILLAADITSSVDFIHENVRLRTSLDPEKDISMNVPTLGNTMEFPWFMIEPTGNYVFVTDSAKHSPYNPRPNEVNGKKTVMYIQLKAIEADNTLSSLTIKTTSDYVELGKGVASLELSVAGEKVLKTITDFDNPRTATFDNLTSDIELPKGTEVSLELIADLQLCNEEKARFTIPKDGIELSKNADIALLPLSSDEFFFDYETYWFIDESEYAKEAARCNETATTKSDGCSCIIIF